MADRTVRVRLVADVGRYRASLAHATTATRDFGRSVATTLTTTDSQFRRGADVIGRSALLMSGAMVAGFGLSAAAAVSWESDFAGVQKTVEGTTEQMADLEEGLREMARSLPATHGEIAAVAEAAGALGIATPHVESFTRTMIDMGETTDLTADQAATAFARIANIMQTPQTDFERMGSTVVDLGNNLAATESEITEMALRISGAGQIIGLSEADVLGFAGALASVGIEAEAGGTAMSRVFVKIETAVREGGQGLEGFAEVAGMSATAFATAYEQDAAGAIVTFIEGLGRISDSGGDVFGVLEDLELGEVRVRDALLRAAGAGDLFTQSLDLGTAAWDENSALADEAALRYETAAAQFEVLRNQVVDLGIDIGAQLLPALTGAAEGAGAMVTGFQEMPDIMQTGGTVVGLLSTGLLGMVGVLGVLGPKVAAAKTALMGMGTAGQFASRNLTLMMGVAGAAVVAIGAVAYVMGQNAQKAREAEERIIGMTAAMREADSVAGGMETIIEQMVTDMPAWATALEAAGVSTDDMADAMAGGNIEFQEFRRNMLNAAEASGMSALELEALERAINGTRHETIIAKGNLEDLEAVTDDSGGAAADAVDPHADLAGILDDEAQAAVDAEKAIKDLIEAHRGAVDPLFGMLDAINGVTDANLAISEAITANSDDIDDNNVSVEEMARLQTDAAEAAADLEIAAIELAAAVQDGSVSVDDARTMLDRWVAQGLITAETAAAVATQFETAATMADRLAKEWVVSVRADVVPALEALTVLDARLRGLQTLANQGIIVQPRAGEFVYKSAGGFVGGSGSGDTVPAMLEPGEFVVRKSAAEALGPAALQAMNAGDFARPTGMTLAPSVSGAAPAAAGSGGGGLVQNFYGPTDAGEAGVVGYREMRRLQLLEY